MTPVLIDLSRFLLRDFGESDRGEFVSYQADPRYLALYDLDGGDARRAQDLFDRFLEWQATNPRANIQLGIFDRRTGGLCGCAGLRDIGDGTAVLGIELAPEQWGRFGTALDVTTALLDYGFSALGLDTILGSTASGNARVAKLARWFGASIVAERDGPTWMTARGWREVDWAVGRNAWRDAPRRNAHSE